MLSSHCFDNPPILSSTCGAGAVEELGGLQTYVTGPPHSKLAILLISDAIGYEAPNLRKLADKVAAAGFLVLTTRIKDVKRPNMLLLGRDGSNEIDDVKYGEKLSAKSEFDSFVKIYPGVAHGWTTRYNVEDESAVKSAEEAHLDMLNWLTKYVK
ncbi:hypothetical protein SLA2020_430260 [Shorea laevis]